MEHRLLYLLFCTYYYKYYSIPPQHIIALRLATTLNYGTIVSKYSTTSKYYSAFMSAIDTDHQYDTIALLTM